MLRAVAHATRSSESWPGVESAGVVEATPYRVTPHRVTLHRVTPYRVTPLPPSGGVHLPRHFLLLPVIAFIVLVVVRLLLLLLFFLVVVLRIAHHDSRFVDRRIEVHGTRGKIQATNVVP
jgi:hypothetical protein